MRRYFTLRCIGMHLTLAVLLPAFAALTIWQFDRATSGNTLSWAYTFEWPLFGGYAIYVWWQLIHDDPTERQAAREGSDATAHGDGPGSGAGERPQVRPEDMPGWALGEARRRRGRAAAAPGGGSQADVVGERRGADGGVPDEGDPAGDDQAGDDQAEDDPHLAAYNRYLAQLGAADAAPVERRSRHGVAR